MRVLADNGVQTGVTMMPILPFIEDTEENVTAIVEKAANAGATYILPWMGMTCRDRQREYFYKELDKNFPGARQKYESTFGDRYECNAPNAKHLYAVVNRLCEQHGIKTQLPLYTPQTAEQLSFLS
jgi:DNA repair photolyase